MSILSGEHKKRSQVFGLRPPKTRFYRKAQSFRSPQKNTAMVPGPVWEPITVPILQI